MNNNTVINENEETSNIQIDFIGSNNTVILKKIKKFDKIIIRVEGDYNNIMINESARIGNLRVIIKDQSEVSIGKGTTIEQAYILARDKKKIVIGDGCMISFQVDIRTSDAHGIYDLSSGDLVNSSANITIGDHVWIGQGATLSKGATIGSNSVIGYNAYVQKMEIPANCIAAGAPARVVKEGITWDRRIFDNIYTSPRDQIDPDFFIYNKLLKNS